MSSEELYEKWDQAFEKQVELEAKMWQILEAADNREEVEKHVMRGMVHDINVARDEVNKAWKEYIDAIETEHAEAEEALARLEEEELDDWG